ncbi:hypothetical protein Tco_0645804 [Tanacetum coccineum]
MDQVTKHNSVQETNDHKRKLDDRRNTADSNNYQNNHNNYNCNNNHPTNKIEGKKPLGLMLPPQQRIEGMLETFPCVKDAHYITQGLALSSVRLATRWVTRPKTIETKDQPLEATARKS